MLWLVELVDLCRFLWPQTVTQGIEVVNLSQLKTYGPPEKGLCKKALEMRLGSNRDGVIFLTYSMLISTKGAVPCATVCFGIYCSHHRTCEQTPAIFAVQWHS